MTRWLADTCARLFAETRRLRIAAEACKLPEDREAAAQLYQQIVERCAGARFYWGAPDVSLAIGPAPRLLGELALLTGDAAARWHLEESIALCRSIGAWPFLELSMAALDRCTSEYRDKILILVSRRLQSRDRRRYNRRVRFHVQWGEFRSADRGEPIFLPGQ